MVSSVGLMLLKSAWGLGTRLVFLISWLGGLGTEAPPSLGIFFVFQKLQKLIDLSTYLCAAIKKANSNKCKTNISTLTL